MQNIFARPWLTLAVSFAAGIALAHYYSAVSVGIITAGAGLLFIRAFFPLMPDSASAIFCRSSRLARLRREYLYPVLLLGAFAGGAHHYRETRAALAVGETFINEHAGKAAPAVLRILAPPECMFSGDIAGSWRAPAELRQFDGRAVAGVRLLVYGNGQLNLPRGSRLTAAKLRIYPEKLPAFAGAFSFRKTQRAAGLSGAARIAGGYKAESELAAVDGRLAICYWKCRRMLDAWRAHGIRTLLRIFPDQRGAFLAAVTFGWLEGLSPETSASFRYSGLGHVLAISGLHVGLVAAIACMLLRLFIGGRRVSAAAVLGFVVFFVILSGGRPSAVRAGGVAVLYFGGILCTRRSDLLNALGLAAVFILIDNPETLFAVGFQFSYLAVLFIYGIMHEFMLFRAEQTADSASSASAANSEHVNSANLSIGIDNPAAACIFGGLKWAFAFIGKGAGICAAAWLGTFPLIAYYFNLCSYGGLLVNLAAVPLLTPVLIGGTGALLCAPWAEKLPALAFDAFGLPAAVLLRLAEWTAGESSWATAVSPPEWMLALYYGMFALFFCRRISGNAPIAGKIYLRAGGLVLATAAVLLYTFIPTLFEKTQPGIYALSAKKSDNFWVVADGRLTLVVLAAEREWPEILRFTLNLGFREIAALIAAPGVRVDEEFLRRLPCRRVETLSGETPMNPQKQILPGKARLSFTPLAPGGRKYCLRLENGRARIFAAREMRESEFTALQTDTVLAADAPVCFLRKMALRKFAGARVFYGGDCTVRAAGAAGMCPREKYGHIFISSDGRSAEWNGDGYHTEETVPATANQQ